MYTKTAILNTPADDSVTSAKIGDDQIDSEHYVAGSIDLEHMSSESVDEDNLHISNAGSNGEFLSKQSGDAGGLTWAAPSGGGWEFVSAQTASSTANIDFTGLTSGYDYQMYGYGVIPATDATYGEWEYGTSGPTYQTSGYDWGADGGYGSGSMSFQGHAEQNGGEFEFEVRNWGNAAGEFGVFEWTIFNPADSGSFTYSICQTGHKDNAGTNVVMTSAGWRDTNEAVTALRFHMTSGNIAAGYFKLFKRANA